MIAAQVHVDNLHAHFMAMYEEFRKCFLEFAMAISNFKRTGFGKDNLIMLEREIESKRADIVFFIDCYLLPF